MKQEAEENEDDVLLIDVAAEVAQDLKEETIEMKDVVEMRDQAQDLKEETIEMKEVVEMRDQAQDLKEETTVIEEIIIKMKAEKENLLVLKKNLVERKSLLKKVLEIRKKDFQEEKNLEINFD